MTWAYFRALSKQNCHYNVKKGVNFSPSPEPTLPAIVPVISKNLKWLFWRWFLKDWNTLLLHARGDMLVHLSFPLLHLYIFPFLSPANAVLSCAFHGQLPVWLSALEFLCLSDFAAGDYHQLNLLLPRELTPATQRAWDTLCETSFLG